MTMPSAHAQDLRGTAHDLARQGGAAAAASDAAELCIFCHTSTVHSGAVAPLWQRSLQSSSVFPIYDDIGSALLGRVGSHSLVCMSCHDATQATSAGMPSVWIDRDHPVGVPYLGALHAARDRADYKPASSGIVDGKPAWWVSPRGRSGMRTRNDLPLFPRSAGEGTEPVPLIECGTCHDPHSTAPLFLRLAPRRSQLCLTCHDL